MNTCIEGKWFENWFNSPYYHILYNKRDDKEAELFIDNLLHFLKPPKNASFLDLACGKGRHSVYLNKKGYSVTGIDLSPESIAFAEQFTNDQLQFYIQDMRKPFRINYFNYVLNLFTSFGYFDHNKDDIAALTAAQKALKPEGIIVLDFMNVQKVIAELPRHEVQIKKGITFNIYKSIENNFIIKRILFSDKGKDYAFEERVKALTLADFEKYFAASYLKIVHLLGNYELDYFNPESSERLIIIAEKNKPITI
ncbi:MAG: class I SAM-dependent methyltransferase [Bacteroidia bacterium]